MRNQRSTPVLYFCSQLSVWLIAGALLSLFSFNLQADDSSKTNKSPAQWHDQLSPVDRALPDFSLQGLNGETWDAKALQGKPWIINFWAGWCPPCIEELPALNNTWSQVSDQGVGMLAINVGEEANKIKAFLEEIDIDFPVVLGDARKTMANWSARALPTTVIVNSEGKVVYEAIGPRDWDAPTIIETVLNLVSN